MAKLSLFTWIGNAAAVLCGKHGDVSAQARQSGCSRQTAYDHAGKVEQAVADARRPGPSREQLLRDNAQLRQENQELWDAYLQSIDFPEDRQRQFTTAACAMGLSLSQTLALLAILLPPRRRPSRATLGRWVGQSAGRARRLLAVLDRACQGLVLALALDEIFFRRRPVLMAVEPASMAWVLGQRAADRSGETWAAALQPWGHVEDVVADGGTGLRSGVEEVARRRQRAAAADPDGPPAVPLHARLDVFHTRRDGARALRQRWRQAEKLWDRAAELERARQRWARTGADGRKSPQARVNKAWARAVAEFEKVCREEQAWQRAGAALAVCRPDGEWNDRRWAQAELAAAVAELTGPAWAKVRRQLQDERTLTFLDRLHNALAEAEPEAERRALLVALWRWRRERRRAAADNAAAVGVTDGVLAGLVTAQLGAGWRESYRRVRRVLGGVLRASSCVECVNSVVRMHQSRHRNLSQELLDLKRLFWNCRAFREGKRKRRCPYELLGLKLPDYDPWALLQLDPAQLEQLLSSPTLTV